MRISTGMNWRKVVFEEVKALRILELGNFSLYHRVIGGRSVGNLVLLLKFK